MSDLEYIVMLLDLLTTFWLIGFAVLEKYKIEELEWHIVSLETRIRGLEIEVE